MNRHTIELGKDDRPSNFLENANAQWTINNDGNRSIYIGHLSDPCDPKGFLPYTRSLQIQKTLKEFEGNIKVNFMLILILNRMIQSETHIICHISCYFQNYSQAISPWAKSKPQIQHNDMDPLSNIL